MYYNYTGDYMKKYFKNIKNKEFIISIMCMLGIQSLSYVCLKFLQADFKTIDCSIDNKIPFIPQVIILYNLFYPMVFLAFYSIFNHDKGTYYKGIIAGIIGFMIADIIFILYPTIIIRPDVTSMDIDPINKFIISMTYKIDSPAINCLPSIHCLFCFQAIISLLMCKKYNNISRVVMIIILSLIIVTTLLVKQHYFLDVIASLIVSILATLISSMIYKKVKRHKSL